MKKPVVLWSIVLAVFVICTGSLYLLVTPRGSAFLTCRILSFFFPEATISIEDVQDNLLKTITYTGLTIENPLFLPQGSIISGQKVTFSISAFNLEGFVIKIFNGAIRIPRLDPLLLSGSITNGILDINFFQKTMHVASFLNAFYPDSGLQKIKGTVNDLDLKIGGPLFRPRLTGIFFITGLSHEQFEVRDCPVYVDVGGKDLGPHIQMFGTAALRGGVLMGPQGVSINIKEPSQIHFNGPAEKMAFDLLGESTIEKTKITVVLKGTLEKPDLSLTSIPPEPEARLLIMLATGKSWGPTEKAVTQGTLSPDIARDFIDYFVLGGAGSKLARTLGISDISVTYEKGTRGVGITSSVTDKIDLTYTVEQQTAVSQNASVSQKVGSEYSITEEISVSAEKEFKPQGSQAGQGSDADITDDKILLKFKKSF